MAVYARARQDLCELFLPVIVTIMAFTVKRKKRKASGLFMENIFCEKQRFSLDLDYMARSMLAEK